jgi:hypothetical protein
MFTSPGATGRAGERRVARVASGRAASECSTRGWYTSGFPVLTASCLLDLQDDGVWLMLGGAICPPLASSPSHSTTAPAEAAAAPESDAVASAELPTNLIGYTQALAAAESSTAVRHALADACLDLRRAPGLRIRAGDPGRAAARGAGPGWRRRSKNTPSSARSRNGRRPAAADSRLIAGERLETLRVFFEQPDRAAGARPVGDERAVFTRSGARTERSRSRWQILVRSPSRRRGHSNASACTTRCAASR